MTTDFTIQDAGIHHANTVCNVVAVLQEVLQQEQAPTETPPGISERNEHVANVVQNTKQQLASQLHQMQTMMQAIQLQYSDAP